VALKFVPGVPPRWPFLYRQFTYACPKVISANKLQRYTKKKREMK